jgi:A/G-specific adenine glycosylase
MSDVSELGGVSLLAWYDKVARNLPWRNHWSHSRDPWGVWLSEIMLQQTVIAVVIPAFSRVMQLFPSIEKFAAAAEEDLRKAFRGLGYYRRFNLLHKATKMLCAHGAPAWPQNRSEWRNLPGVGGYTSAALASIVNNEPCGVVDGNVERVLCRVNDWREPTGTPSLKKKCQIIVDRAVNAERPGDFNQALMQIGQMICTPAKPNCAACPLQKSCKAYALDSWRESPAPKSRPTPTLVNLKIELVKNAQNEFLLVKRSQEAKFLKNSWGFPTWNDQHKKWDGWKSNTIKTKRHLPVGIIKHSITTHRITAGVTVSHLVSIEEGIETKWAKLEALDELLVSNLDRKALQTLLRKITSAVPHTRGSSDDASSGLQSRL